MFAAKTGGPAHVASEPAVGERDGTSDKELFPEEPDNSDQGADHCDEIRLPIAASDAEPGSQPDVLIAGPATRLDPITRTPTLVREPGGHGPAGIRTVQELDPTLDAELAEWHGDTPRRPKIAILGKIRITALGPDPDRQPVRMIEMAVYLALYPRGVSTDKFATDLRPERRQPANSGCRADMSRLRRWFGSPEVGQPFVRSAVDYRITDRLLDAELFTRLAARANALIQHGDPAHAMEDLQAALGLVRGPVLPEAAGPGYSWLANPDRMDDRTLPLEVIDAAHTAVDIAWDTHDLEAARKAAKIGRLVDPYSSIPLCDLIRVAQAENDQQSAAIWANLLLQVNDVDLPADLPETARDLAMQVLRKRPRKRRAAGGEP